MGGKHLCFTDYERTKAKKRTKREKFPDEMEQLVSCLLPLVLIEPVSPKASTKGGRPPYPLAITLRILLMQQWYSLIDPVMEDALIEVPTMRRFVGIELISDPLLPGKMTPLHPDHFHHQGA